jgi:hypothetical protein
MMKQLRIRHAEILLGFWMALTTVAPAQVQPAATVHIYRYKLTIARAAHPSVSCDASPVVKIQNGRVFTMKVPAGSHNFSTADNPTGINVAMEPGKEYFVRIDYPPNTSFALHAAPVLVAPEQGRQEIQKLRQFDAWFVEGATCGQT